MSCHPSHEDRSKKVEEKAKRLQEEQERTLKQQKRDLSIDPRKIRRQHRWSLGHDPADQDEYDDPNLVYIKLDGREAPPTEPDQRDMLSGGPPSGMDCEKCGTETRVVGSMSVWEQYQQREVSVVNLEDISEARKKELQEQRIVVLKCPQCLHTYQWFQELLPKKVHND
ncbi:hypothetical protein LCGC14_2695170 [marine sediment metagenome]|uniref:Uncharacterized protein n=1 Tax=marine sediment metagenome TaxID=412755 RepID=A0A0F8ZHE9_9ZZZZ